MIFLNCPQAIDNDQVKNLIFNFLSSSFPFLHFFQRGQILMILDNIECDNDVSKNITQYTIDRIIFPINMSKLPVFDKIERPSVI